MFKKYLIIAISSALFAQDISPVQGEILGVLNGTNVRVGGINFVLAKTNMDISWDKLTKEQQEEVLAQYISRQTVKEELYKIYANDQNFKNEVNYLSREYALEYWTREQKSKIVVKDEDAKKYYDTNIDRFVIPKQYKLKHIVVKNEAEANEIIAKLKMSSPNLVLQLFSAQAKEHSIDAQTSQDGGELGWYDISSLTKEYAPTVEKMQKGEYIKLQNGHIGWIILLLDDVQQSTTVAFEKVQDDIKELLKEEIFNQEYEKLVQSTKTKVEFIKK